MKRKHRLRTPAQFQAVRESASRGWPHALLVVYVAPNNVGVTRVGITASGRVGKAVVRNKVRRRLREALRARLDQLPTGLDVLVIARPAAARASWQELNVALDRLLENAGATALVSGRV